MTLFILNVSVWGEAITNVVQSMSLAQSAMCVVQIAWADISDAIGPVLILGPSNTSTFAPPVLDGGHDFPLYLLDVDGDLGHRAQGWIKFMEPAFQVLFVRRPDLADERQPAEGNPAASQERRARTPVERPTRQHEPSRSPHPSDGQTGSRRSRSGTPPWERRRRERRHRRRREASEVSSDDNERRLRAKRKRDVEDIGERIDSLNFGYDFAPQTPEEQLMKYEMEAESARFHAKRFKCQDERLFAEGRARIAQRMADLQESQIRGA
ncbi:hypothetical protein J4E93_007193 [Alternaria ventricosa]|uniref:uncharacterized protein n=1 Tax=Alternaria ventricosa TaxID=1187951 RepID=UPI0020C428F2|nr:uncharacterized protein J4E93_007193 [Alternaria ventricosa]KAI4643124.1 hypothetical protein J4E93_007193 [Alternaria ventricosa]